MDAITILLIVLSYAIFFGFGCLFCWAIINHYCTVKNAEKEEDERFEQFVAKVYFINDDF